MPTCNVLVICFTGVTLTLKRLWLDGLKSDQHLANVNEFLLPLFLHFSVLMLVKQILSHQQCSKVLLGTQPDMYWLPGNKPVKHKLEVVVVVVFWHCWLDSRQCFQSTKKILLQLQRFFAVSPYNSSNITSAEVASVYQTMFLLWYWY